MTKRILPGNNKFLSTYREAENLFRKLGMGMEKIDACLNDCILYYKENIYLDECPTGVVSR